MNLIERRAQMDHIYQKAKYLAFTLSFAAGMSGLALAQTNANQDRMATENNESVNETNSNSMVRHAQRELKRDGYYTGRIDGINGPETRSALRRYQRSENLTQTGNLDEATISSLGLNNTRGENRGEASRSEGQSYNSGGSNSAENTSHNLSPDMVRDAQRKLSNDGFYRGRVDGVMNEGTRAAIRQYQKQNNLPVTGRLTLETAQSMGISTSNGSFENSNSPLEQLGKGIAEGAKTPQNTSNGNRQHQHNQ
jgi:peptidoglycan hydrolase-like protein with peptidoglycan-binding domain